MSGINNVIEALDGAGAVSTRLIELAKDGIQLTDFIKLGTDAELIGKLTIAAEGIQNVPAEVKDLDRAETAMLVGAITRNTLATMKALGVDTSSEIGVIVELLPEAAELIQSNIAFAMKVKAALDKKKAA